MFLELQEEFPEDEDYFCSMEHFSLNMYIRTRALVTINWLHLNEDVRVTTRMTTTH